MSNEGNGSTGDSSFEFLPKLLKQIISKLNDWAALSTIALFILAAPIGRAIGDYGLSFIFAFLFSLPLLVLRAFQIHRRNHLDAIKLDNERAIKLATIDSNLRLKLARIEAKGRSGTSSTSTPSDPAAAATPRAKGKARPP